MFLLIVEKYPILCPFNFLLYKNNSLYMKFMNKSIKYKKMAQLCEQGDVHIMKRGHFLTP